MNNWCKGCPLENRPLLCNQDAEECEKECRRLWPEFYDSSVPKETGEDDD